MATCTQCKKVVALGGIHQDGSYFCSQACHAAWKEGVPGAEAPPVPAKIDSTIGRIAGLILAGIGGLGILGNFLVMWRRDEFQPMSLFVPVIFLMSGIALFNKCNGKK